MKKIIYRSEDRGRAEYGWLHSKHSFSFGNWYDPDKMGFGVLRVLNDDIIEPGQGFGTHPHDNMEIITIILDGALEHRDSMGSGSVIYPGEVQVMSAGSGVTHSEFNPSKEEKTYLLQIWINTKERNIKPRYDQRMFDTAAQKNNFNILVSGLGDDNSLYIHQDAVIAKAELEQGAVVEYKLKNNNNGVYLFVIDGAIETADEKLFKRDAIGLYDIEKIIVGATENSSVLLIEIPLS